VIHDRIIEIPVSDTISANIQHSIYSNEINQAYVYAYSKGITTISNIEEANIN
jgi:hypothetical protein